MNMKYKDELDLEEGLYKSGTKYDVIHYCRKVPTRIRVGTTITFASSISGGKKIIAHLQKCGNYGDYEIREHIFPWDSFIVRIKKKLFGRVYYESDVDTGRQRHNAKLKELKQKHG